MGNYKGAFVGLTTVDVQYFVEQFPKPNEKMKVAVPDILVGGPATNASVAFSVLGGDSFLASAVGKNPFSGFIADDFRETGVKFTDIVAGRTFSPIIATVITSGNGDRSIVTHHPARTKPLVMAREYIDGTKPDILLVDGFYPEFSIACAEYCNVSGIPVVADCGSWKPQYEEMLKFVDIAICSSDFFPPCCENSDEVFGFFKDKKVAKYAISRGKNDIIYENKGQKGNIAVGKVKVVDTLGAGDFLHGAFCYYYLENGDFETALNNAASFASYTCCWKGTRKWINQKR